MSRMREIAEEENEFNSISTFLSVCVLINPSYKRNDE